MFFVFLISLRRDSPAEIEFGVEPEVEEMLAAMVATDVEMGTEVEERVSVELPLGSVVIERLEDGAADGRRVVIFKIATGFQRSRGL